MSAKIQTPVAECGHCGKGIRQNRAGIWGARKRDDPHPWYCDDAPDKSHAPGAVRPHSRCYAGCEHDPGEGHNPVTGHASND